MTPTFGKLVKEIRKELGINQMDFCKAINTSQGSLSKIEHDDLCTNYTVLVSLSRFVADKPKAKAKLCKFLFEHD